MFSFLFRKMLNNKWMITSLLIGNILLVGMVSSVPLYSTATLQRMLVKEMEQYQLDRNAFPGFLETKLIFMNAGVQAKDIFYYMRGSQTDEMLGAFDVPSLVGIESINIQSAAFIPEKQREERPENRSVVISAYKDIESHITITQGNMFSEELSDGVFEAIISRRTLETQKLLLGETLVARGLEYKGKPLRVKIVGIFENSIPNDYYWTTSPNYMSNSFVISHKLFEESFISNYNNDFRIEAVWQQILDYNAMSVRNVNKYIATDQYYRDYFEQNKNMLRYKNNFMSILSTYQQKADKLNITLWVLQVPVFILLAFFIFMVSKQILVIEQNEISVIKSRGASRRQIITVYMLQSLLVCCLSIPVGIPLGIMICRLLGSSNGFLNLIQRTALNVRLIPEAFLFSGVAAFFSLLTMTIPVLSYSKVTIVDYKRSRSSRGKPVWQRLFLDIMALGISIYGLYSFNREMTIIGLTAAEINTIDPLLFLSSSLFIIGLGLFLLRIYPFVIKLVFNIGKKFWSPSFYASFIKLLRSAGDEQFIMIFLVLTVATGIFDAKAARTINLNSEDKIKYEIGADLVLKESWTDNRDPEGGTKSSDVIYTEPDFGKYTRFEEAESVTKVLRENVSVNLKNGRLDNVGLMGIITNEFGETAWHRDDLFRVHFYDYLNVLSKEPSAVLLSSNFRDTYGYKIGDAISYRDSRNNYINGPIHGFVDYWPGFVGYEKNKASDGQITEKENWLIVANLNYIQAQAGLAPYEVWMKTEGSSNNFFYSFAGDNQLKYSYFADCKAEITKSKNDPMLQGTNGVLTVGFITIIVVCATGFLIFWILSIKSRVLQFGIFRAMGMSMRNIISLLVNEQFFITLTAIGLGAAVGEISSRLFVPIIQIAYSAAEQTVPFKIITRSDDYFRLFFIIGMMIIICMAVIATLISKIKIAQALKLGED